MSKISKTPEAISEKELEKTLSSDLVSKRILEKNSSPQKGDLIGVRLNLNIIKSTGVAVQTIHKGTNKKGYKKNQGFYGGEAVDYAGAVVLSGAFFNVHQRARELIASGEKSKFPMASIDGQFVSKIIPENFEGLEVSFNPKNHHLFVTSDGLAVRSADTVVVIGHRAYCTGNITLHTSLSAPQKVGDAPSQTIVSAPSDKSYSPPKPL